MCLRKSRARYVIRHACGTTTLRSPPSTRVLLASDASLAELEHAFAQQQHDANPYGLAGFTGSSMHSPGRNEKYCVSQQYLRRRSVRGSDSPSKPHLRRPTAPAAGLSTSQPRRARKRAQDGLASGPACTEDFSRERGGAGMLLRLVRGVGGRSSSFIAARGTRSFSESAVISSVTSSPCFLRGCRTDHVRRPLIQDGETTGLPLLR